eukprot:9224_1
MSVYNMLTTIQDVILSHKNNVKIMVPTVGFGLCAIRAIYCYVHRNANKYPPGPIGIPFLGSFLSCGDLPKYASHLASNYGEISMIYIGSQPFVFLHSIELINEAFKNNNALDREWDNSLLFTHLKPYEINIAMVSHKYWTKKRKRFQRVIISRLDSSFLNTVHNKSLNCHAFDSINECIQQNKLWYPRNDLGYIFFHAIWNALYGSYIKYNSKHKENILKFMEVSFDHASIDIVVRYLRIQNLLSNSFSNKFSDYAQQFANYLETQLYKQLNYDETIFDFNNKKWDEHFKNVVKNKNSCAVSKLIAHHRQEPGIDSTKTAIIQEISAFFNASVHTSLHTAEYGLVALAKYDEIQEQIYNELKREIGEEWQMETVEIKKVIYRLHYLRAFVHDILRVSCVSPLGIAHFNPKCDVWLKNNKYCIPKNSVIVSDAVAANRQDPYWKGKTNQNTMKLCLNLWLDENNRFKYDLNKDKMVTFGLGPRDCVGKSMALRSLYLLYTKLILNYKFNLSSKDKNIEIKQKFQIAWVIDPQIGLQIEKRR